MCLQMYHFIRFCRRTRCWAQVLWQLLMPKKLLAALHGQFQVGFLIYFFYNHNSTPHIPITITFRFIHCSVFVALSTFGAVNGILLTSSRLFYAGACEGQMPEILTMIQIHRLTPTPAILAMALLSLVYLTVSDIYALINYVGFATWVNWPCFFEFINANIFWMSTTKIVLFNFSWVLERLYSVYPGWDGPNQICHVLFAFHWCSQSFIWLQPCL